LLTLSVAGDAHEQEAARMAQAALDRTAHERGGFPALSPRASAGASSVAAPDHGHPLPSSVRSALERGFAQDFSAVRVHDAPADRRLAHELSARAFTYDGDIWLGDGQRADDLPLMAHELAHVVQQNSGSGRYGNVIHRQPDERAAAGGTVLPANPGAAKSIQFKGIDAYPGAEVPATVGSGGLHTERAGTYILGPNAIQCLNGEFVPLYYLASHMERKRAEWIVGPDSVAAFKAQAEQRAQTAAGKTSAPDAIPVSIPLNRAHAAEMKKTGIEPHYMARSVPYTSTAAASGQVVAGNYDLIPHSVHLAEGGEEILYYVAKNKLNGYDQWFVGPDSVAMFQQDADAYLAAAGLAYFYGPPHGYEAESVRFVFGGGSLSSAWKQAAHDPKFLVSAAVSHVPVGRVLKPLAGQARGMLAATTIAMSEVPALTLSAAPKAVIQVVEGSTAQAVSRQVAQPVVTAAAEAAATELAPAAVARASAASHAAGGASGQLISGGVKAATMTVAPTLASGVDPEIDQRVERAFVEHAPTTRPASRPPLRRVEKSADAAQARAHFQNIRDSYARALQVAAYGQVHHAIEVQVLSRYPGVYSPAEINQAAHMRGIPPERGRRTQLHNAKIREVLDRHYRALDEDIARRGLRPGTPEYNALVRAWINDAVAEIDYTLGQFFSEQRAPLFQAY
jgi:hypothetical protein